MEVNDMTINHTLNIIARGFIIAGYTNYIQKRYTLKMLAIDGSPVDPKAGSPEDKVTFFKRDSSDIHPYNNDLMVISV